MIPQCFTSRLHLWNPTKLDQLKTAMGWITGTGQPKVPPRVSGQPFQPKFCVLILLWWRKIIVIFYPSKNQQPINTFKFQLGMPRQTCEPEQLDPLQDPWVYLDVEIKGSPTLLCRETSMDATTIPKKKDRIQNGLGFQPVDGTIDSEVEYHLSGIIQTRYPAFIERLGTHSLNKKTCGALD